MGKKKKLIVALAIVLIGFQQGEIAFAAPSEVYGYKRLEAWDFHDTSYDKNEKIRVTPSTNVFDTKGIFTKSPQFNILNDTNNEYIKKKVYKKIDLMGSASVKNKPVSSESGTKVDITSGASTGIATDVVFDFDMLSNAVILKSLGVQDGKINKIVNNWNATTRTVISKRGMSFGDGYGVDYESYLDKAVEAFMEGKDLSFEEFAKNTSAVKLRHLPYKAKYMLEDGTFGDQMVTSEINSLNAPVIQPNIQDNISGQALTLYFERNPEWAKAITDIQIGENYLDKLKNTIPRSNLGIEDNKLTVRANDLKLGKNVININARGYRTVVLDQNIVKSKTQGKLQEKYVVNKEAQISELTPEFLNDISKIKLNGRALHSNEWSADVAGHKLNLESSLFSKIGQYKITIETAANFETLNFNIEVGTEDAIITTTPAVTVKKQLPTLTGRSTKLKEDIEVNFDGNSDWEKAVYKVQKIDKFLSFYKELEFKISSGKLILKQGNVFTSNGKYTIRVFATGYEPVDVDVNIYDSHPELTMQNVPRVGSDFELGMQRDSFDYDWVEKINAVYIDGKPLTEWKTYRRNIDRLAILKDAVTEPGVHLILVKSTGYEDALKRVTYGKADGGMIEVPKSQEMEVPVDVVVKTKEIEAGKNLIISAGKTGYQYKINGIYLDGEKLKLDKNYSIDLGEILVKEISGEGQRKVRITADGYKDQEFTFKVNKAEVIVLPIVPQVVKPEVPLVVKPELPSVVKPTVSTTVPVVTPGVPVPTLLEVPTQIKTDKTEIGIGSEAKIWNLTFEYKNSIKEIYLNEKKLNKDEDYTISFMGSVIIQGKLITKVGKNKIVIKAEGYKEKEFTFNVK